MIENNLFFFSRLNIWLLKLFWRFTSTTLEIINIWVVPYCVLKYYMTFPPLREQLIDNIIRRRGDWQTLPIWRVWTQFEFKIGYGLREYIIHESQRRLHTKSNDGRVQYYIFVPWASWIPYLILMKLNSYNVSNTTLSLNLLYDYGHAAYNLTACLFIVQCTIYYLSCSATTTVCY